MKRFTNACVNFMNKFLPDAFIFAVILTIIVFIAAMPAAGASPLQLVMAWGNGVWGLLAFSMQMALVVVTGTAFATAPIVKKVLEAIAKLAKTPAQGVALVVLVSGIANFLNWGFGLIVGALLGRAVARQLKTVDYRMLIAAGYSGFVIWHAGMSGSIPLALNTAANLNPETGMANTGGAVTDLISTGETIFSVWNLIMIAVVVLLTAFIFAISHPRPEDTFIADPKLLQDEERTYPKPVTPAEKIENSRALALIIGIAGLVWIIVNFFIKTEVNGIMFGKGLKGLDLNAVNFIFLILGLLGHGTPIRYVHAVIDAAKGAAGVILQFPFYAGIQAMMVFAAGSTGTSLAAVISNFFVSISNNITFPVFTFLAAGIVNFFVSSGGGQWAVQGPIMMPAGLALGVKPAVTGMAIAWGDQWTNMIQPFWALPALGAAGLGAKDIMGYCVLTLLVMGVVGIAGFLLVGALGLSAI
ncbi:MAG: short-chain fatty acid transporter [Firmicutes bacterium]|nr:short-chain fatty acid transporter [Bacillota bacterium]